ncbi:MAG: transposase [bacterium]
MKENGFRKHLSISSMLEVCRKNFDAIPDAKKSRSDITLSECLMSGLALFGLKYPSLLQFDQGMNDETIRYNLRSLYGIQRAPSDTWFRERLDEVKPEQIRKPFKSIFSAIQRGKALENFRFIDGSYLLSVDGTGYFYSDSIHCDQCCEKHHRDGSISYYHQMLGAVLVHPDLRHVLPLAPEPILKQDGVKKNDCERNAAKRLLHDLRREHPHLKLTVIEDGLASNVPHIQTLRKLNMNFILGAKEGDHAFLFDWVNKSEVTWHEKTDRKGNHYKFRFINQVPLNESNLDYNVNFLEVWETSPKGRIKHFSWVTDFTLTRTNIYQIMRGGRARWKIENETFNTLKNQGYHFEHNFGHGKKHLSTVMAHLMLLAFLIDQVQALVCLQFQQAVEASKSRKRFWIRVRSVFTEMYVESWDDIYLAFINGRKIPTLTPNTS